MQQDNQKSYRRLIVWQKADEMAFQTYLVTKKFPREEMFGLISQMQRAAVSVPANIAEGYARLSRKKKFNFTVLLEVLSRRLNTIWIFLYDSNISQKKNISDLQI